jgi:hypothetical protein
MCENSHHDEKFTGLAQNSQVGPAISQLKISIRGLKLAQNMCQPVKVTFNLRSSSRPRPDEPVRAAAHPRQR